MAWVVLVYSQTAGVFVQPCVYYFRCSIDRRRIVFVDAFLAFLDGFYREWVDDA